MATPTPHQSATHDLDAYVDMVPFRDDGRLAPLSATACMDLVALHDLGRLALNDEAGPLVMPVNYLVDGGTVVFRTTMGSKLAAADRRATAAFQVDRWDHDTGRGWSVLVRGRLQEVLDGDELDRLAGLDLRPSAGGHKGHWIRVMPRSVTGRAIGGPAV